MIDLAALKPGDEYVVEWADGDRQRYRVEELRDGYIIRKRWIESKMDWSPWVGVQKINELRRFQVSAVANTVKA